MPPARRDDRIVGAPGEFDGPVDPTVPRSMEMMEHSEVTLFNGQIIEVEGDIGEVEKVLSDAARSGHARFAWLIEHGSGEKVGVNPDQVLTLRGGEPAAEG